jgi:enoyl-CoA hydratase/carnithine racemase
MHERELNLQATTRPDSETADHDRNTMSVIVAREDRPEGGHIVRLTIDNASKLNSLNRALMVEVVDAVAALASDPELRLVVVTGAGDRAFVGGADIGEIATLDRGLELAAACDLRVASERAVFGMPEVRVGIPSVVEAALLPQLIGHGRARRLLLTGVTIDAAEALEWALVDAVVPPERLDDAVERFVAAILAGGPQALRLQKRLILDWEELPTSAAIARGIDIFAEAFETDEPRRMAGARLAALRSRNGGGER